MPFEPRPVVPPVDRHLPPDYLQALGFATAAWNAVRHDLIALFTEVCELDRRIAVALLTDMRLSEVSNRIRSCALLRGYPAESSRGIEHALATIEICRENRAYIDYAPPNGRAARPVQKLEEKSAELHVLGQELWRLRHFLQELTAHLSSLGSESPRPVPDLPPLPGFARETALERLG